MIGHLQRNKVKYIAPFVDLIHSVDSEKLLREINKEARKNNRKIKVLLQVHIAQETEKFGFSMEDVSELLKKLPTLDLENIEIIGLMGMATYTEDSTLIAQEFTQLHELKISLNEQMERHHQNFKVLSMGMSGDYKIALANGSTMIRIGSAIFGSRNYA
ncbi:MAG: YggS family pyridoxal phosphate-dependent enzyme, partial [Flammeovirgaceae bacterium]|nr:YggS family pyridoxal phosphate-dependent enzyme [Flammeovirgaceae bacterium]